ncbi:MAG: hypothetical protein QNL62_07535 [Gammaproteobacteria bacterium]|nr:hypothetical protein [Gammaproteobacteria bacterium]
MNNKSPLPGVSREQRISDEGLKRLETHLQKGTKMSHQVLRQWIKRYGEPAREIIKKNGQYTPDLE